MPLAPFAHVEELLFPRIANDPIGVRQVTVRNHLRPTRERSEAVRAQIQRRSTTRTSELVSSITTNQSSPVVTAREFVVCRSSSQSVRRYSGIDISRQPPTVSGPGTAIVVDVVVVGSGVVGVDALTVAEVNTTKTVSYTHLTLPTSDLV